MFQPSGQRSVNYVVDTGMPLCSAQSDGLLGFKLSPPIPLASRPGLPHSVLYLINLASVCSLHLTAEPFCSTMMQRADQILSVSVYRTSGMWWSE